jgi:excisionase family DNA binding protein
VTDRLLNVKEAALILRVSPRTVYRLIGEAQFRCCKVRGGLKIWSASVDDYLARQSALWEVENGDPEN